MKGVMKLKLDSLSKISEVCKKHSPDILSVVGIVEMVTSTIMAIQKDPKRLYEVLYQTTGNEFYKTRYMQITHSNNWLKMHGYPMNRKSHIKN